jgi:hypothetical protein
MQSNKIVIESPMSFAGSRKRILNLSDNAGVKAMLWFVVLVAWIFVGIWYVFAVGIFGWLLIPFRIFRRGSRRDKRLAAQHREMMEQLKREA